MSKIKLVLFRFGTTEPLARDFSAMYEHNDKFELSELVESSKAISEFENSGNGIFIFKINNKEDLQKAVTVLKSQKKLARSNLFKSVAYLSSAVLIASAFFSRGFLTIFSTFTSHTNSGKLSALVCEEILFNNVLASFISSGSDDGNLS